MMETKILELDEDINVFYVEAESFPGGIPATFNRLNDLLGASMKERHLYGVTACLSDKLVYRAGIKEDVKTEDAKFGLDTFAIPKGKYAYATLYNWPQNLAGIPGIFDELLKLPNVKKQSLCVEDYTTADKMLLMVQVA